MKKIKSLLLAVVTLMAGLTFTACNNNDDNNQSVHDQYQAAVTSTVKAQKAHNKAILLVAFGSTWQQAYDAFDETVKECKKQFPNYDVFLSFSSVICINRAMGGEHVAPRNFYAPSFWLNAFAAVKYDEIVIQSLQVIPGEEYKNLRDSYIKNFANNFYGDLDDNYLSRVKIYLGTPLMAEESDVTDLANELYTYTQSKVADGSTVALMGHGNPEGYDYYGANIRYTELEEALQAKSGAKNYYVGTVDMPENYKTNVVERMKANNITSGKVYCYPLMSIAGDHAHNDMAGDDDAWDEESKSYEFNEEGEVEDTSWKCYLTRNGYTCNDDVEKGCVIGLLEIPAVRQLWFNHITRALKNDYGLLDYYHSKNPED